MSRRRVFELSLDEVSIKHDKPFAGRQRIRQRLVLASLVWPRPAIAERNAVLPVDFGKEMSVDMRKQPWSKRILFKEQVEGPFGIGISVTEIVSDSVLGDALAMLGQAIMNAGIRDVADIGAGMALTGALQTPFRFVHKTLGASSRQAPTVIASGLLDMDILSTWKPGKQHSISIKLEAPEDIVRKISRQRDGKPRNTSRTILKAGQPNGTVKLRGMLYE